MRSITEPDYQASLKKQKNCFLYFDLGLTYFLYFNFLFDKKHGPILIIQQFLINPL